jgi:hypothetical protein
MMVSRATHPNQDGIGNLPSSAPSDNAISISCMAQFALSRRFMLLFQLQMSNGNASTVLRVMEDDYGATGNMETLLPSPLCCAPTRKSKMCCEHEHLRITLRQSSASPTLCQNGI